MITIAAGTLAIGAALSTSFGASGGTGPYTWSVLPGGAGGSIGASTGLYTAPAVLSTDPKKAYDVVKVVDSVLAEATIQILAGNPLQLVCDIIQREMGLAQGQVYLWDQKIDTPNDSRIYIAVGVLSTKPFGNRNAPDSSGPGVVSKQSVNVLATLSIDIMSRSPEARERKEEVLMALFSDYSKLQQTTNSFGIARLASSFQNLSEIEGAAIPYRFNISVNMQYVVRKASAVPYNDDFENPPTVQTEA